MHITLVNMTQIVANAQTISVIASLLCGGFATYLLLHYRTLYPAASKVILACTLMLTAAFVETVRHVSAVQPDGSIMLLDHSIPIAMGACVASMAFGLLMILLVRNHDRLVSTVRRTFRETTSVVRNESMTRLTRTQRFRIIEKSNIEDILVTLNLITSPSTTRLLRAVNIAGWGLVVANLCFIAVIEFTNHL